MPRLSGKFLTQVTSLPVFMKVFEFAPIQMYKHMFQTLGLAILLVTASHIMKYPKKFRTPPNAKTTHGGVTWLIRPERIPVKIYQASEFEHSFTC
jgi:hypothetical protein